MADDAGACADPARARCELACGFVIACELAPPGALAECVQGCLVEAPPEQVACIANSGGDCAAVLRCADQPPPQCGNGQVEEGEGCDDGNRVGGDGCDANCQAEPVPAGGNFMLCGQSDRNVAGFVRPEDGLEFLQGCVPNAETVALLVSRTGAVDGAVLNAFLARGGNVITEYSRSDEVWNAVFPNEPVVQSAAQNGSCRDNLNPAVRYNEADPFWVANGALPLEPAASTGCGFDLTAFPNSVPLGAHSADRVNLAYRDVGAGRLWLVEGDWQDNQQGMADWNASSQQLMRHMIRRRRGGPVAGDLVPGVRQNVPEEALLGIGWRPCFRGTYDQNQPTVAQILADCRGEALLMACRQVGDPTLALAAEGLYADVTFDVGGAQPAVHTANGVNWYFNNNTSWGFAPEGAAVNRNSCDTLDEQGELRMCWHTSAGNLNSGYRCGNEFLNGNARWERLVYVRDQRPRAEDCAARGDEDGNGLADCADPACAEQCGQVRLGELQGYGHHGDCETFNGCNNAQTCADSACAFGGHGAAVSWQEDTCGARRALDPTFDCDLFHNLDGDLDQGWDGGLGFCDDIMVAYDVVCAAAPRVPQDLGQPCMGDVDCDGVCWDFSQYDPFCFGAFCSAPCQNDQECGEAFAAAGAQNPGASTCGEDGRCTVIGTGFGAFACQ
ncbi:MAG: hypothetical protein KC613_12645 [Myxococcales bacterium]|nr:hypothetical protein [Myxococcales bacterium]